MPGSGHRIPDRDLHLGWVLVALRNGLAVGPEADKIAAALGTPILLSAKGDQQIREEARTIVLSGPRPQIQAQALWAFRVRHFRKQPHTREKPVMTTAASEGIHAKSSVAAFPEILELGTANISSTALRTLERRAFHVVSASVLGRRADAYSDW